MGNMLKKSKRVKLFRNYLNAKFIQFYTSDNRWDQIKESYSSY